MVVVCLMAGSIAACGSKPAHEPASDTVSIPVGEAPRPGAPLANRPVIVALGDSLTAGLGVDADKNYPARLQQLIDAGGYAYRVVNAGVSGDTSAQGLNRLQTVLDLHPEIVIVALGANDGLRGLPTSETARNLDAITTALLSAHAKVILAGMEMPPNLGPEYTRSFRQIYTELAKKHNVPLIPFLLAGVGGIASLNQEDGIHPTAQGYEIVSDTVWKTLRPLLKR